MSTIKVSCPACARSLEVDEESIGKQVECGECLEVFVARAPESKVRGKPSTSRKKPSTRSEKEPARRRQYDDDDDYEHDHPERTTHRTGGGGTSTAAVFGMLFGILSVLSICCALISIPMGITAIVLGSIGRSRSGSSGMATAASILGSIGLIISSLLFLWFLGMNGGRGFNPPLPGR